MKRTKRIKRIQRKIGELKEQINVIRKECPHTNVTQTIGAMGDWCEEDGSYWYDCVCQDCGEKWKVH